MKRLLLFVVALLFSALALAAVNINTATKEELDSLPGIGPVKAQAIIDYRKANGPFKTPEDIMKVSGIKEGEFGKLKGLISVSGASTPVAGAAKSEPVKAAAPAAPASAPAVPAATPAPPAKAAEAAKPLHRRPRRRARGTCGGTREGGSCEGGCTCRGTHEGRSREGGTRESTGPGCCSAGGSADEGRRRQG